jgi:F0F1-type ATP synthase assembly protein I
MADPFKNNRPRGIAKPPVWRLLLAQIGISLVIVSVIALIHNPDFIGYWALGVGIYSFIQASYILRVFAYRGTDGNRMMRNAYRGESTKILVVGLSFGLLFYRWPDLPALPLLGGFSISIMAQFFYAGFTIKRGVAH